MDRDEDDDRRRDDPRHVEDRLAPGLGWLHLHAPQSPTPARRTRPARLGRRPARNGTARLTLTKGFSPAGLPLGHAACTIAPRTERDPRHGPRGPRAASKRDGDGRDGRRRKHGMKHATTRMIFGYWDALRGERSAPERGEIEPGEIRHVLADTFVLEVRARAHRDDPPRRDPHLRLLRPR